MAGNQEFDLSGGSRMGSFGDQSLGREGAKASTSMLNAIKEMARLVRSIREDYKEIARLASNVKGPSSWLGSGRVGQSQGNGMGTPTFATATPKVAPPVSPVPKSSFSGAAFAHWGMGGYRGAGGAGGAGGGGGGNGLPDPPSRMGTAIGRAKSVYNNPAMQAGIRAASVVQDKVLAPAMDDARAYDLMANRMALSGGAYSSQAKWQAGRQFSAITAGGTSSQADAASFGMAMYNFGYTMNPSGQQLIGNIAGMAKLTGQSATDTANTMMRGGMFSVQAENNMRGMGLETRGPNGAFKDPGQLSWEMMQQFKTTGVTLTKDNLMSSFQQGHSLDRSLDQQGYSSEGKQQLMTTMLAELDAGHALSSADILKSHSGATDTAIASDKEKTAHDVNTLAVQLPNLVAGIEASNALKSKLADALAGVPGSLVTIGTALTELSTALGVLGPLMQAVIAMRAIGGAGGIAGVAGAGVAGTGAVAAIGLGTGLAIGTWANHKFGISDWLDGQINDDSGKMAKVKYQGLEMAYKDAESRGILDQPDFDKATFMKLYTDHDMGRMDANFRTMEGMLKAYVAAHPQFKKQQGAAYSSTDGSLSVSLSGISGSLESLTGMLGGSSSVGAPSSSKGPGSVGVLTPTPAADGGAGGDVISIAMRYLGTPYAWGGNEPGGFDCSGLVQFVYKQRGVNLPRTSTEQSKCGSPVGSLAEAAPGDLLFWDNPSHVHHVAIYLGDGKMLEAPYTGAKVRIVGVRGRPFIRRVLGNTSTTKDKTASMSVGSGATNVGGRTASDATSVSAAGGHLSIPQIAKLVLANGGSGERLVRAVATAWEESNGGNTKARNYNPASSKYPASLDRGLWQINDYWHKEVKTSQADDPVWATQWVKRETGGFTNWSEWSSNKASGKGVAPYEKYLSKVRDELKKNNIGYAQGAWEIQQDQYARVHSGEMVIPKHQADALRKGGLGGTKNVTVNVTVMQASYDEAVRLARIVKDLLDDGDSISSIVSS